MTDFSELEAHPGNRDFERVNALVCMGWKGTESAAVQEEPTAELFIAEDKSCEPAWTAASAELRLLQVYGEARPTPVKRMLSRSTTPARWRVVFRLR